GSLSQKSFYITQLNLTAVTLDSSSITGLLPSPSMDSGGVVPALLMSFCFLVGLPGNIAVIILKPNFQQLSSMTQSLMLTLAVSDLLVMLTVPLWVYTVFYGWIFGLVACKIIRYYMFCCVYASLLTIVTLSLQRYMLVVHQQFWNQTKMRLILVLLWLFALILSIPALVVNQLTLNQELVQCKNITQKIAVLLAEALVGFASLPIVAFSYIQLYRKMKHTTFFNNPQTSRLVTSIVIVFFLLWIPNHTVDVVCVAAVALHKEALEQKCTDTQDIVKSLTFINSCLNPLLYAFTSHICKSVRRNCLQNFSFFYRGMYTISAGQDNGGASVALITDNSVLDKGTTGSGATVPSVEASCKRLYDYYYS
uniref:G-protein coupled receptors family 1 profile domain-containing protein n=1 Tax=Oryzias latipes TaxID=8090 RepID=A0A3P9IJV8_ORYLA